MGLELPSYAVEHTEMLYSRAKRRPIGYMFDVAQAFVYQVFFVFMYEAKHLSFVFLDTCPRGRRVKTKHRMLIIPQEGRGGG